jgi:hypothetical protein
MNRCTKTGVPQIDLLGTIAPIISLYTYSNFYYTIPKVIIPKLKIACSNSSEAYTAQNQPETMGASPQC